jgi:hypothetical protein
MLIVTTMFVVIRNQAVASSQAASGGNDALRT